MFPCGGLGSPGTSARGPDGLRLMGSISEGPMLESRAGGFGASQSPRLYLVMFMELAQDQHFVRICKRKGTQDTDLENAARCRL